MTNKLIIHTDGGARGNPGPAAIGVVFEKNGKLIHQFGKKIGEATNNVAEYTAVIEALKYIKNSHVACHMSRVTFFLDSVLVVNQLTGKFKVKDAKLRMLLFEIRSLEQEVRGVITYTAIPREQNKEADLLVNRALDKLES
ncbi:ribonuclease HI family protein [Patescibacteria group bacterium]|nr:ribonuclease HI family protein [Patescibacteria group bacterium]